MNKMASKGNHFVLTKKGYEATPDRIKPERKVGEPIKHFDYSVPISWVKKEYVEEKAV